MMMRNHHQNQNWMQAHLAPFFALPPALVHWAGVQHICRPNQLTMCKSVHDAHYSTPNSKVQQRTGDLWFGQNLEKNLLSAYPLSWGGGGLGGAPTVSKKAARHHLPPGIPPLQQKAWA